MYTLIARNIEFLVEQGAVLTEDEGDVVLLSIDGNSVGLWYPEIEDGMMVVVEDYEQYTRLLDVGAVLERQHPYDPLPQPEDDEEER